MRRIVCLLLLVAGCDNHSSKSSPDLSMVVVDNDMATVDGSSCAQAAACTVSGGAKGLCKSGACAACTDTTDDLACDTAYSQPTMHYICGGGACVVGCRTSNDCAGQICGISTANVCGACTTDTQCQMALGNSNICDSTGKCVSSACTNTGSACTANPADICCASGAASACVTGSCCSNSDCSASGKSCVNHVCTNCPSPSPGALAVDPSEVLSGTLATGADVTGCRYKTITTAMGVATAGTTIKVLGTQIITGSTATCANHTGECYPISVKAGVTVKGDSTMVPTISVPNSLDGVWLQGASSGLSTLILDGSDNAMMESADYGVVASIGANPSPSPYPTLDHVTIRKFSSGGIYVNGGNLAVQSGTSVNQNAQGMEVRASGNATVTGGADPITFNQNDVDGVTAQGAAVLTMTGTPGSGGTGSIVCNQNTGSGISLLQGSTGSATLTGVVAWRNSQNGLTVVADTTCAIRSCSFLANTKHGVDVQTHGSNIVSVIDFGKSVNGLNVLQDATNPNLGVGICNETFATTNILSAQGNKFSAIDCTQNTPGNVVVASCSGHGDIGPSPSPYIDVTHCGP